MAAREIVPVVVIGPPVNPVPVAILVTVPVPVMELHPKPELVVHVRASAAAEQDGIDCWVAGAEPPVAFPRTVLEPIEGRSRALMTRKVGVVAPPLVGPAKKVFADWLANDPVSVPVVVTGDPVTVKTLPGRARPTEVTVPVPEATIQEGTPEAFSDRTVVPLLFPGRLVHPDGPR